VPGTSAPPSHAGTTTRQLSAPRWSGASSARSNAAAYLAILDIPARPTRTLVAQAAPTERRPPTKDREHLPRALMSAALVIPSSNRLGLSAQARAEER
jgi:hypothetical protein